MSFEPNSETICALASGAPPAGIAVIRVSGSAVLSFITTHISGSVLAPHVATLRRIRDAKGVMIDEGLVVFMPRGASYTSEDVVELHLHGGRAVVEHALDTLTEFPGIRLAEPGEFTRRAFEAGRLDLTQAEGIADLIEAETRAQKAQALAQTDGALGALYSGWRDRLLKAMALLEASIDFPDEAEAPETVDAPVLETLGELKGAFVEALREGVIDQRIRDGFRVAILGAPNAGKSTLLNRLSKREAAIVTEIPGTTRDIVEVRCRMAGQIVWFVDTAGLRETTDQVEAEGIRRARLAAQNADLRIFVSASDAPLIAPPSPRPEDIWVRNKADLDLNERLKPGEFGISALTGSGFEMIETAIKDWLARQTGKRVAPVITRARHRIGIERALGAVERAVDLIQQGAGAELASEDIRMAMRALSSLIGEIGVEEVLGAVFSEFCIGK